MQLTVCNPCVPQRKGGTHIHKLSHGHSVICTEKPRTVYSHVLHFCVNMKEALSLWWTRTPLVVDPVLGSRPRQAASVCIPTSMHDLCRVPLYKSLYRPAQLHWAPHWSLLAQREPHDCLAFSLHNMLFPFLSVALLSPVLTPFSFPNYSPTKFKKFLLWGPSTGQSGPREP